MCTFELHIVTMTRNSLHCTVLHGMIAAKRTAMVTNKDIDRSASQNSRARIYAEYGCSDIKSSLMQCHIIRAKSDCHLTAGLY